MMLTHPLQDIPDADLLVQLKTLVGRSNQLTATVLAHLAEVEARGIYRDLACSSLYAYCVYELRMSEDEAQRRIIAARAVRRFPVLLEMIETAAIHLTGIVLLAPHLTEDNHERLLAAARYRSKREIQKLVATVAPRPDIPARVEPLAPEPRPGRATWAAFLESLSGGVRDLPCGTGPGEAPWAGSDDRMGLSGLAGGSPAPARVEADRTPGGSGGGTCFAVDAVAVCSASESPAPARVDANGTGARTDAGGGASCAADRDAVCSASESPAPARVDIDGSASGSPAPARMDVGTSAPELRYKVQFTASESYVRLLEEARNLLQHKVPNRDIARVHELAMEALVAKLRKRRGAPAALVDGVAGGGGEAARAQPEEVVDGASRRRLDDTSKAAGLVPSVSREEPDRVATDEETTGPVAGGAAPDAPTQDDAPAAPAPGAAPDGLAAPAPGAAPDGPVSDAGAGSATTPSGDGTRGRYVAAAIERGVWQRDGWQCTFVDDRGQRCRERSGLEIHHREAHWCGGAQTVENLTLHCRAHNQLMAERELGREYVRARIETRRSGGAGLLRPDERAP